MIEYDRWDAAKDRMTAWWARANETPLIRAYAPLPVPMDDEPEQPVDAIRRWTDPEIVVPRVERGMARTYYAGDAYPLYWPNLGPSTISAFLGCPLIFGDGTSWQEPIVEDWDSFLSTLDSRVVYEGDRTIFTHPTGQQWWQATLDLTRTAAERARGRYLVGLTDLGAGFDLISHLRYPTRLCEDFIDCPEHLPILRDWLSTLWFRLYDELTAVISPHQEGTASCLGLWSRGRHYPLQSDFSCMVSTPMFEEYILPDIALAARTLENTIYHLDGPDAARHLDALLSVPEIDAIQWVPGAGAATAIHWIPMLKKIQAAGKGLYLDSPVAEIAELIEHLRPEGLMIATWCPTIEEADAAVAMAQ